MMFLFGRVLAGKRLAVLGTAVALLIAAVSGIFLLQRSAAEKPIPASVTETATAVNLGFTYLAVTPRVAAYYRLGVNSGALVTEVVSGSPAEKSGVKVGDVILSFNGNRLENRVSLLGMMRECTAGNRIVLEVWREEATRVIEFIHTKR